MRHQHRFEQMKKQVDSLGSPGGPAKELGTDEGGGLPDLGALEEGVDEGGSIPEHGSKDEITSEEGKTTLGVTNEEAGWDGSANLAQRPG